MKKVLSFLVAVCGVFMLSAQNITGAWYGTLDAGAQKLRLIMDIQKEGDGYATVMISVDQSNAELPMTSTTFDGRELVIESQEIYMTYKGVLEGEVIEGTFVQFGHGIPLTLSREEQRINRPQTPNPPYPYTEEQVLFTNKDAGIRLAGTLTIPKGKGKFPAVVMVTGSGPSDRDETLAEHKPFMVIADYLTRNGIAVLRYDDRGCGESEGMYFWATLETFADDAVAAVDYLCARPEIDKNKVGVIGHSEGGSIAYMIAGYDDVAFIVSMAGPAVLGAEFMLEQRKIYLGYPSPEFDANERVMEAICEIVDNNSLEYIYNNTEELAERMIAPECADVPYIKEQYMASIQQMASPEMVSFRHYDPTEDLRNIDCPVLAIVGSKDTQVPPHTILPAIAREVNPELRVTLKEYYGLNHMFQTADTGLASEYGEIEETISPEVLKDIADWIKSVTR